jgi:hypothetical protein
VTSSLFSMSKDSMSSEARNEFDAEYDTSAQRRLTKPYGTHLLSS